jgi:hypothetical protein
MVYTVEVTYSFKVEADHPCEALKAGSDAIRWGTYRKREPPLYPQVRIFSVAEVPGAETEAPVTALEKASELIPTQDDTQF